MKYDETTRVADVLNEAMLTEEYAQPQRAARSFHASGIYDCSRQQIYDRLGYPKVVAKTEAHWIRSREVGDLIHEYYAERFRKAGILVLNESSVPENPWDIGGRLDDLLQMKDVQVLVDIKTVTEKKFKEVPKGDKFKENYAQVQLYMHLLGLSEAILLYVNRSDNAEKEFTIYYDEPVALGLIRRAAMLKDYYDRKVVPRPEISFKCRWCDFNELCGLDGDREVVLEDE